MEKFEVLTGYEKYKALGKKGAKSDKLFKDAELRAVVQEVLASKKDNATIAEVLIAETIQEAIENPSTTKLKDIMIMAGQPLAPVEINTNSTIKSVNSELEKEAIGETKW